MARYSSAYPSTAGSTATAVTDFAYKDEFQRRTQTGSVVSTPTQSNYESTCDENEAQSHHTFSTDGRFTAVGDADRDSEVGSDTSTHHAYPTIEVTQADSDYNVNSTAPASSYARPSRRLCGETSMTDLRNRLKGIYDVSHKSELDGHCPSIDTLVEGDQSQAEIPLEPKYDIVFRTVLQVDHSRKPYSSLYGYARMNDDPYSLVKVPYRVKRKPHPPRSTICNEEASQA